MRVEVVPVRELVFDDDDDGGAVRSARPAAAGRRCVVEVEGLCEDGEGLLAVVDADDPDRPSLALRLALGP